MALTYGLSSARELLSKLERDAGLLDEEVTSDRFFNFVVTGYSLIDWIRNDPSVPSTAKATPVVDGLYNNVHLKVCGDLATASKHFSMTRRVSITDSATSDQGFGVGRYGVGGFGVGEGSIEIVLDDGTSFNALDLARDVVQVWQSFFKQHGI